MVSYFLNTNTESNHFPVPMLGRFLNQLWLNVSRAEGAQKSKMEEKTMWKCHWKRGQAPKETVIPIRRLPGADGICKTW